MIVSKNGKSKRDYKKKGGYDKVRSLGYGYYDKIAKMAMEKNINYLLRKMFK